MKEAFDWAKRVADGRVLRLPEIRYLNVALLSAARVYIHRSFS